MSENEIEALLERLLGPRLGHVVAAAPRLRAELAAIAREEGRTPLESLRALDRAPRGPTFERLLHAGTVPHTSFFRHPDQIEALDQWLRARGGAAVEIWCAGCATGEEAWTIALVAAQAGVPVRILATDVSAVATRTAREGRYPARRCRGLPPGTRGLDAAGDFDAPVELRRVIRFETASLVEPDPAVRGGPFDLVVCRNVLLYFTRESAREILAKLAARLRPGGALLLAPAETLIPPPAPLAPLGPVGWLARLSAAVGEPGRMPARRPPAPAEPGGTPAEALTQAARMLGSGDADAAEVLLRGWLETHDRDGAAWFLLGEALVARNEPAQARVAFRTAAACAGLDPTLAAAATRRAAGR